MHLRKALNFKYINITKRCVGRIKLQLRENWLTFFGFGEKRIFFLEFEEQ